MREKHVDLRIVKTREALSKSLIALLKQKPFQDIKVSELCDLAKVSRATFYNNFNSLDEVLTFYLRHLGEPIYDEVRKARSERNLNLAQTYHLFIELCLKTFDDGEDTIFRIFKANPSSRLFDCVATYFKEVIAKVLTEFPDVRIDVPMDLLVSYLAGGFAGLLLNLMSSNSHYTIQEKTEYIYHLTYELYFSYINNQNHTSL